jgi:lipopolysaccharide/colanic/teichoic acid biosynthesis glycosyltransferase
MHPAVQANQWHKNTAAYNRSHKQEIMFLFSMSLLFLFLVHLLAIFIGVNLCDRGPPPIIAFTIVPPVLLQFSEVVG